jgi:transcriptional regulator with XRE-family HTH domain
LPRAPARENARKRRDPGPLALRIKARMAALRRSNLQLAALSGIPLSSLNRILSGQQSNPKLDDLDGLATALDWDISSLLGLAQDAAMGEATSPQYAGRAEVGNFKTPAPENGAKSTHARPHNQFPPRPRDPRLAAGRLIWLTLADNQLEGIDPPVPEGEMAMVVVLPAAQMPLETGWIYLIHHTDSNGRVETSFRRLNVYDESLEWAVMSPDRARNERERLVITKDDLASGKVKIGGVFFAGIITYR